jgi:hypothetical protein
VGITTRSILSSDRFTDPLLISHQAAIAQCLEALNYHMQNMMLQSQVWKEVKSLKCSYHFYKLLANLLQLDLKRK